MKRPTPLAYLRTACVLAVVGLAFMMWSLLDPRAQPVLVALSFGQLIGTTSLVVYFVVVIREYRSQNAKSTDR